MNKVRTVYFEQTWNKFAEEGNLNLKDSYRFLKDLMSLPLLDESITHNRSHIYSPIGQSPVVTKSVTTNTGGSGTTEAGSTGATSTAAGGTSTGGTSTGTAGGTSSSGGTTDPPANDGPLDVVDPSNPIVKGDPTKPLSDSPDVHQVTPSSTA
jgi:hypothetical protein